jgi:hypothetical protein
MTRAGVVGCLFLPILALSPVGCERASERAEDAEAARPEASMEPAAETARGPNGGALVRLGEDTAVLEWTLESETGRLHMYVWEPGLESPLAIPQEMLFVKLTGQDLQSAAMLVRQADPAAGGRRSAHFAGGVKALVGRAGFEVVVDGVTIGKQSFRLIQFPFPEGNGLEKFWPVWAPEESPPEEAP